MRCGEFRTSYAADMAIFESAFARRALAVFLVALAALPFFASSYWLDVLGRIGIAIIGAIGLNILTGFTGQISLGNAAFLAVGAYTTAALGSRFGLPFPVTVPLSGLAAAVAGMFFGIPSLRLKGLYLAMATLAAHFIIGFVVAHWESATGGVNSCHAARCDNGALGFRAGCVRPDQAPFGTGIGWPGHGQRYHDATCRDAGAEPCPVSRRHQGK